MCLVAAASGFADVFPEMAEALKVKVEEDITPIDISAQHPNQQYGLVHIKVEDPVQLDHNYCKITSEEDVSDEMKPRDKIRHLLLQNDTNALLYMGIGLKVFDVLVSTMEGYPVDVLAMSVRDQLLMTLMKLKTNQTISDLSNVFCVSQSTTSQIISYWIDKLEEVLRPIIPWLPKETIQATMPQAIKENFPNMTCVVHCSKCFLQKHQNLDSKLDLHDNDELKYMVALAPCGLIMFISAAYKLQCKEKFMIVDSGILNMFKPGDEVVADQNPWLNHLLAEKGVKMIVPSMMVKEQLASAGQVEIAIKLLKSFRILSQVVSPTMAPKINKILRICSALVNLM